MFNYHQVLIWFDTASIHREREVLNQLTNGVMRKRSFWFIYSQQGFGIGGSFLSSFTHSAILASSCVLCAVWGVNYSVPKNQTKPNCEKMGTTAGTSC